ncbi:hypothetical protein KAI87_07175, partial [Myxococcota bacterium]|nr:hypothetical protein [Myxococcota bacterium]
MGGLVRKMPISFISMLIGIIALAGVPPLSGFSGKWLIYHALMDKGWYFLLAMLMFSSMIAFLYLYRIIHSVFLGQLKKKHENVKEAPIALIAAQMILMVVIMGVSVFPGVLISPLQGVISSRFGDTGLSLESLSFLGSKWGFFDAMGMMSFTVMIFVLLGLVLATFLPRTTKVKQLDMVFAGEIPPPPEEQHYSVDMYQPFERAFEPVMNSHVKSFWKGVANWTQAVADMLRRLYSGNGQTYLIYAVALVVILGALWTGIGASKSTAKVLDANQKSAVAASAIVDAVEEKRR